MRLFDAAGEQGTVSGFGHANPVSQSIVTSNPRTDAPVSHDNVKPSVDNRTLLVWMFRFLKPVWKLAAVAALFLSTAVAIEIYTLKLTGDTINHIKAIGQHVDPASASRGIRQWFFSHDADALRLRLLIILMTGCVIGLSIMRYMREVQVSKFSMGMVYYIREAVYDKLQRVGFGFHDNISSGQLINRALSDLQNVRAFVQTAVLMTLEIILVVSGNIVLILTKSPWLALLALVPIPIWTAYILMFSKRVQPATRAVLEAEDKAIQVITENIAGVHVVKAFATEQQEVAKYTSAVTEFQKRIMNRVRLWANFQPVIRLIASASNLSLFFVAGVIIINSRGASMSVGDLMILGGAMGAILGRLQQVATINEQYQNAIVSARRLWEVIDAPPTVPEKPDAVSLPKNGVGEVVFENVSFGYDPAKPVLRNLNYRVGGGKIVAIVGPTGAGKSSMVNLVSRFYDPQEGRILLDGIDLRDLKLASLRTQVSFVFQETYLFSDTVAANIAYGRPGLSQGEIEAAARLAQAHDFIEALPQGYETPLGERGANLSGGQRQRLAIARAIVTNPRVLILDDATAAIDPETEDLIRRGMRLTLFGRTTFIIAHRISTVKSADLVLVLENGRITQMGTHDELMCLDGHYREIARVQLSTDDEPPPARRDPAELPSHMDRVRDPKVVAAAKGQTQEEDQKKLEETL